MTKMMTILDGKRLGPPGIIDINTDLVERRREGGRGRRRYRKPSAHPFIRVGSCNACLLIEKSVLSRSALSRRWTNKSSALWFHRECTNAAAIRVPFQVLFNTRRGVYIAYADTVTNVLPTDLLWSRTAVSNPRSCGGWRPSLLADSFIITLPINLRKCDMSG